MALSYKEDYPYANEKLSDTIVKLNNNPIYINNINSRGVVSYQYLGCDDIYEEQLEKFDLTPVELGYVNTIDGCDYVARMPERHYKQGLRSRSLSGNVTHRQLIKCLVNSYPTISVVKDNLMNGERSSQAFSRKFSLGLFRGIIYLYYKGKRLNKVEENPPEWLEAQYKEVTT